MNEIFLIEIVLFLKFPRMKGYLLVLMLRNMEKQKILDQCGPNLFKQQKVQKLMNALFQIYFYEIIHSLRDGI